MAHDEPPVAVAVLGAGTLGHAIAQCMSSSGHDVRLFDPDDTALDLALTQMSRASRMLEDLGVWTAKTAPGSRSATLTSDLGEAVLGADVVIEAAPEHVGLKRQLLADVEKLVEATCVLASNSSTIPSSVIGRDLRVPGRVLNWHFFNPAQLVPLVEVCGGPETDPAIVDWSVTFLTSAGKEPVVLKHAVPGFVANRLQAALFREAMALVDESVASPEDIDRIVTSSIGRRLSHVGVFKTADLAGLDIFHALARHLFPQISAAQTPSADLEARVRAGHLGAKAGRGYYNYPGQMAARERSDLLAALAWRASLAERA